MRYYLCALLIKQSQEITMKTIASILAFAALLAPQAALAQRHTTPGQKDRHIAAQAKGQDSKTHAYRLSENERQKPLHLRAAKAGKINVAKGNLKTSS